MTLLKTGDHMIYLVFIGVFLALLLSLFVTTKKSKQSYLWGMLLAFYVSSLILFIIYISKDLNYFSRFHRYFPLPIDIWNKLILLDISKDWLIRLLNLSCLLFIYSNVVFCCTFISTTKQKFLQTIKLTIMVILALQFLLYDPAIYKSIYSFLYPYFITATTMTTLSNNFCMLTYFINGFILLSCIGIMFLVAFKSAHIKFVKYTLFAVSMSYTLLIASYMFILSWAPTLLIKYSKIASFTRYQSVKLSNNMMLYFLFPYLLILLFIVSVFSFYKYLKTKAVFLDEDLQILRTIDAATITSRIFCHYMKNELLSLSAEVEEIEETETNKAVIESILKRCDSLYNRLNHIHKSTSDATLNLTRQDIRISIENALAEVSSTKKLDNISVLTTFPSEPCIVLIDSHYFEQSLINMLFNAAEALAKTDKTDKTIYLIIKQDLKWTSLFIKDNGIGIKEEDLSKIFTPLYSTNPITKNWGIGLSLAYKIIMAHDGKISVKSEQNIGTTFEILLPNIKL